MLDFSNFQRDDRFSQPGRSPALSPMSPQQARQMAQDLLVKKLPPSIETALQYLSVGGVFTAFQMGISPNTLKTHRKLRIVDRLPFISLTVVTRLDEYGLPIPERKNWALLYNLGPVGVEIVKMRYGHQPPSGYASYTLERIMHDVVLNEIVLQIVKQAILHGWDLIWVGEGEAALYHENQQILKPDAMLRLKKDGLERVYLIEYHNEDKSTRALEKVQRYERTAFHKDVWAKAWEVETFPPVLAAFRHSIVGTGYNEATAHRDTNRCTFYGRVLSSVLEGDGEWFNFATGEREFIWPWG